MSEEAEDAMPRYTTKRMRLEIDRAKAQAVREFTAGVLHGDIAHRTWLIEASECFLAGKPLPEPNGLGRAEAAEAKVKRLREALKPFSGDKLPGNNRDIIDYDYHGLRRAMSPMEIARRDARKAYEETSNDQ